MTRPSADLVKVEWSGTGTSSPITLGAAVSGYQAFPAALGGQVVSYAIEHTTSIEKEAGYGVYTHSGTTLTRFYRTYPTVGGAAVNFSAGIKHVRVTALAFDIAANITTTNPTTTDDLSAGYRVGDVWINTSTPSIWICVNATVGSPAAAVWLRVDGSAGGVDSVNGLTGAVTLDAANINAVHSPSNYTPVGSPSADIESHLSGIDTALGSISAGTDQAPTPVTSNASPFALTTAARLHNNVEVLSHTTNVDFEVATTATAASKWYIRPLHTGCTVSVNTDVGSINGTAGGDARIIFGGVAIVEVATNSGSAPAVLVRGDVIVPPAATSDKTYTNDDHGQVFRVTGGTTQTFSASANYRNGFECVIKRETSGTITIAGVDASYTLSGPDFVYVSKDGTALTAVGKAGIVTLDAA